MSWFSDLLNNFTQSQQSNPIIGSTILAGRVASSMFSNSGNSASSNSAIAPSISTYGGSWNDAKNVSQVLSNSINKFKPTQSYAQNMSYGAPINNNNSNQNGTTNSIYNSTTGNSYSAIPSDNINTGSISGTLQNTTSQNNQSQTSQSQSQNQQGQDLLSSLNKNQSPEMKAFISEQQNYLNSFNTKQQQLQSLVGDSDINHTKELNQINAEFSNIKSKQERENSYREEAARQIGISSGLAFSTPGIYPTQIANVIDSGISTISDITSKQNSLIQQSDKASIIEKKGILEELNNLSQQKYNALVQTKNDLVKYQALEDQQNESKVMQSLPAVYSHLETLNDADKTKFLTQMASNIGVPVTSLLSTYRTYSQSQNQNVMSMYNDIATKIASNNPQLAIKIAQLSQTPEGRKQLESDPTLLSYGVVGQLSNMFSPSSSNELNWDKLMHSIGITESSNNYKAVNKTSGALGKYQVMPQYLQEFSTIANKQFGTPILNGNKQSDIQTFLNTPEIQDQVFKAKFQSNLNQLGGDLSLGIASWFSGIGGAKQYAQGMAGNINDGSTSVPDYVKKALNLYNGSNQNNNQQYLEQAKQNLASLGGTKINIQQLQNINNPSTLWTKATTLLPSSDDKKSASGAYKMSLITQKLNELRNIVGEEQFGLISKGKQNFKQIYGGTNGQEVSRLVNNITTLLQSNRADITGAAWGSKEDKEYLMKIPNQKDSTASWYGKIEGLLDSAYIDSRNTIGNAVGGDDIFDSLYGDMFKIKSPTSQSGGFYYQGFYIPYQ